MGHIVSATSLAIHLVSKADNIQAVKERLKLTNPLDLDRVNLGGQFRGSVKLGTFDCRRSLCVLICATAHRHCDVLPLPAAQQQIFNPFTQTMHWFLEGIFAESVFWTTLYFMSGMMASSCALHSSLYNRQATVLYKRMNGLIQLALCVTPGQIKCLLACSLLAARH